MKTLLVALEFPPAVGGVETYYGELVAHWPSEIKVITNEHHELISPVLPIFGWLKAFWTVGREIGQYRPDWVLVGEILPLGTVVYLLSCILPVRYGVVLHGLDFAQAQQTPRKRWLARKIINRAGRVICANSVTAKAVTALMPENHPAVVNPGVDVEALQTVSHEDSEQLRKEYHLEDSFLLVTVGRLVPRKGMDKVIEALPGIIKTLPQCHYVIIGDGPYKSTLESLIKQYKVQPHVTILSGLDNKAKNAWLAAADIFIMPTRVIGHDYEGFGIVYLEAGLQKKPVIAGRGGGVGEAVLGGVTGLQVNGEDTTEITAAVLRLAQDRDLRQRLGDAGYEYAQSLSWSRQIAKLYSALVS